MGAHLRLIIVFLADYLKDIEQTNRFANSARLKVSCHFTIQRL